MSRETLFNGKLISQVERMECCAGDVLYEEHAPVEHLFYCDSGEIRVEGTQDQQKPIVLYRANAGQIFGCENLFCNKTVSRAIAVESSFIKSVKVSHILELLRIETSLAFDMFRWSTERQRQIVQNFGRMAIKSAKLRLLDFLNSMLVGESRSVNVSGKLKCLSDDLGLTHEAVYRAIKELENDGLIERKNGQIVILQSVLT